MLKGPEFDSNRSDVIIRESIMKCQNEKSMLDKSMANSLDVRLKEKMYAFDDDY